MSRSRLRSRDRQRLRRRAAVAVEGVPTKFVLEALAGRFGIADGKLEVRFRGGFMVEVTTSRRLEIADRSRIETNALAVLEAVQGAAESGRIE